MKTLRILMLALLIPAFVMTGCGDDGGGEGKPTYTVSFNADGGTPAPAAQKVTEGEKATTPAAMTKIGYTFLHWSKDGAAAYDFATPVTANFTLTAQWKAEVVAEPEIEIPDESELTQEAFADDETTGGFTFTAKSAWTATVTEATTRADGVKWLRLLFDGEETYSGVAGNFTIVIELDENYSGKTRTATITIKSGNDTITITVTQDGKTEDGEVPVDPDPNGYAALLAAHEWFHVLLADSDDTTYDDMDATIVFGRDGTISASGVDSDVFTDYFVNATFEITDETFTLLMSEEDAADSMLGLEEMEFDIVTLTDDKFEVTGTFGSRTIAMTFAKEKPEIPVEPGPIPDAKLRDYLIEQGYIVDKNGEIEVTPAGLAVQEMYLWEVPAKTIKGIELFPALTTLALPITVEEFDPEGLAQLTYLAYSGDKLTSIDFSHTPNLRTLYYDGINLTSIDLGVLPNLTMFACRGTKIEEIDISNNKMLDHIYLSGPNLSKIYVWWTGGRSATPAHIYMEVQEGVEFVGTMGEEEGITILPLEDVFVKPNESVQLSAVVVPDDGNARVLWTVTSGDATVDQTGLVKIGTYAPAGSTIVVTAAVESGMTATKWITVAPALWFTQESLTMSYRNGMPGGYFMANEIVCYSNFDTESFEITYSDPSVLRVNRPERIPSAIRAGGSYQDALYIYDVGECDIIATAYYQGEPLSASIHVTITHTPATSVTIDDEIGIVPQGSYPGYVEVLPLGSSYALGSAVLPDNASFGSASLEWSSSDPAVLDVYKTALKNGPGLNSYAQACVVTATGSGTATITATNRDGLTDTRTTTVFIEDTADLDGTYTWEQAKAACAAKGGSWRLPTRKELDAMAEHQDDPEYKGYKVNGPNGYLYWSGEQADNDNAYARSMYLYVPGGAIVDMPFNGPLSKSASGYVRCVK